MKETIKKLIIYLSGSIIVFVLGAISYPILTRIYSPEEFGKYSLYVSICDIILVAQTFGLDNAFVRFFYTELENNRVGLLYKVIKYPLILTLFSFFAIYTFNDLISQYFLGRVYSYFFLVFYIQLLANYIKRFGLLYIRMEQKAKLYSFLNILPKSFFLFCVFVFFMFSKTQTGIYLIISITFGNVFIAAVLCVLLFPKAFKNSLECKIRLNKMLRYSLPFMVSTVMLHFFESCDKIMLKSLATYSELGIYSGAMGIVSMLNILKGAFSTYWTPIAMKKQNEKDAKSFYIKANNYVTFVMLLSGLLCINMKNLFPVLLGEEYSASSEIFPLLVLMPILYTILETIVIGINISEKTEYHIIITSIPLFCNVLLNFILIRRWQAVGAAVATGMSTGIYFIVAAYFSNYVYPVKFCYKRMGISICALYVIGIYASFHLWNYKMFFLNITFCVLIFCLYRTELLELCTILKRKKF